MSTSKPNSLFSSQSPERRQRKVWEWLVEPAASIQEPDARRQARLLSSLLIVLILFVVGGAVSPAAAFSTRLVLAGTAVILIIAYGLSRTSRNQWGAFLAVGVPTLLPFINLLISADYDTAHVLQALIWTIVAILVGSTLLSVRATALVAVVNLSGIASLIFIQPGVEPVTIIFLLLFVGANSALILVTSRHRSLLEADRLQELRLSNARLEAELVERRRAEMAFEESEARYRSLVELSPEPIVVHRDGRFIYVNPATATLLGAAQPDELIGRSILDVVHPDYQAMVQARAAVNQVEGKPTPLIEEKLLRLDGQLIEVEVTGLPTTYFGKPATQVIIRDITERKHAEAKINREAARADALVRVAARLNAQLDLASVLKTVCEEAAGALNVSASSITLNDEKRNVLYMAEVFGLPVNYAEHIPPVPRQVYDTYTRKAGTLFVIPDLEALPSTPDAQPYLEFNIRSIVSAGLFRDERLVGNLNVYSLRETHPFTEDELALLKGLADQAAQAITNARLFEAAKRRLSRTQTLRQIDRTISGSLDLRFTLRVIVEEIIEQLNVDAVAVLLVDPYTQALEYAAGRGFRTSLIQQTRQRLGEGSAGRAALGRETVNLPNVVEATETFGRGKLIEAEGLVAYYAVPLISKGRASGVLEVFHRTALDPDSEWLEFLEMLGGQVAIAIDNATLFDGLQRSNTELSLAYDTTLEGWSRALDLRDKETEGHTQRVTELTVRLSRLFNFNDADLVQVRRGALLHDIGKMGIPDNILLKTGPLTEEELGIMRRHPVYAYELLAPIAFLKPALDIPYCHHEKWDGTGYPRGLKGEQIPLSARLFTVVDVWDALRTDRPYRQAWPKEKVREHIRSLAGTHFDPNVVETFLAMAD